MFVAPRLMPAIAVMVTAAALAAPAAAAPADGPPLCNKQGKEVKAHGNGHGLSVCPTFPGDGTPT
jgi:hypothetical protein